MKSFFDQNYHPPRWFKEKLFKKKSAVALSRRSFLKSAAGASAIGLSSSLALPAFSLNLNYKNHLNELVKTDPWLTLDATLTHLLPESASSTKSAPSAKDINALAYLYQVITVQPISKDEKEFILNGVDWLNAFAQSQQGKSFVALPLNKKEAMLRGISKSQVGENWLTTLLAYLFEAMLSPPAYGGNPNGIGWQWLDHQAGFPLPTKGQRYYELPPRSQVNQKIAFRPIDDEKTDIKKSIKRSSKA